MAQPRAVSMIRPEPHYRADAAIAGLEAAGFKVLADLKSPQPGDVLLTWNRYGPSDIEARRFENAGATVIVMENGLIGAGEDSYRKVHDANGEGLYVLALAYHNGPGPWAIGAPGRWREQGIEVQPWRTDGEEILVLPARGIGPVEVAQPRHWMETTVRRLGKLTKRRIRVRAHPGNGPTQLPLAKDLANAWAVVTWGSGAAVKAIAAGVPAFYQLLGWVGAPASLALGAPIERPFRDDAARERMLDRLAWMQWSIPEIETGAPFLALMELERSQAAA
jgi:hypothetical protein